MDWTTLQAAIKTWFAAITGLPVVWENEPRPTLLRNAFGILGSPSDITPMGQDWVQETVVGTEIVPTVVGQRIFTVACRVISRSHTPSGSARHYTERARLSLKMPSILAAFRTAGLAVVRAEPTKQFDAPWDDRVESVASFELTLAAAAVLQDIGPNLGTIGTVLLTSEAEDDVPTPPNYVDEPIEIDP